jgi:hypothetical protein
LLGVGALAHVDVGAVEAAVGDVDLDLVAGGRRDLGRDDVDDLGAAELADLDLADGVSGHGWW